MYTNFFGTMGGNQGQITPHLVNAWNATDGHGTTAYLGNTNIEIVSMFFIWKNTGSTNLGYAYPAFSLSIKGIHDKDFIKQIELPSVRYSSHIHTLYYNSESVLAQAPGINLYARDIIDRYYPADSSGYHFNNGSIYAQGQNFNAYYKRIAPMTYNDAYNTGFILQGNGPNYEYTSWTWFIRQEGSSDATRGRRKENAFLNYLGNNTSNWAQLKPDERIQKSTSSVVGYTINKTGWLNPGPGGVPVGIYFNTKAVN